MTDQTILDLPEDQRPEIINDRGRQMKAKPIQRLWLHTCHFDHPKALGFYRSCGFKVYKFEVEVHPDPRLTGHLPRHLAPHVPMIG